MLLSFCIQQWTYKQNKKVSWTFPVISIKKIQETFPIVYRDVGIFFCIPQYPANWRETSPPMPALCRKQPTLRGLFTKPLSLNNLLRPAIFLRGDIWGGWGTFTNNMLLMFQNSHSQPRFGCMFSSWYTFSTTFPSLPPSLPLPSLPPSLISTDWWPPPPPNPPAPTLSGDWGDGRLRGWRRQEVYRAHGARPGNDSKPRLGGLGGWGKLDMVSYLVGVGYFKMEKKIQFTKLK